MRQRKAREREGRRLRKSSKRSCTSPERGEEQHANRRSPPEGKKGEKRASRVPGRGRRPTADRTPVNSWKSGCPEKG